MEPVRFAVIGTGWRAEFFLRIAKLLPERFTVTGVLCRTKEKGDAFAAKHGVPVVNTLEELLAQQPEYTVLSVAKPAAPEYLMRLFAAGMPVLAETPPAEDPETMYKLYEAAQKHGARCQIAEQYLFQPLYAAWLSAARGGMLGEVSNASVSALHGYHAASILRLFLDAGFGTVQVRGEKFEFPVTKTDSREGFVRNGAVENVHRERLTFRFENGKTGFSDFSPAQYHSFIRTRHFSVQGTRGEIDDLTLRCIDADGEPLTLPLVRSDLGVYNNNGWAHRNLTLGSRVMFENPFPYARLNDDEIAVATCMQKMGEYVRGGAEFYPLAEGLQDAVIADAMKKALETGETVTVDRRPWAK